MRKVDSKSIKKVITANFIVALFMYALGFAFIATMACHFMITEILDLEILLTDWMVIVLPTILLLFITYTFGTTIFFMLLGKKK